MQICVCWSKELNSINEIETGMKINYLIVKRQLNFWVWIKIERSHQK